MNHREIESNKFRSQGQFSAKPPTSTVIQVEQPFWVSVASAGNMIIIIVYYI